MKSSVLDISEVIQLSTTFFNIPVTAETEKEKNKAGGINGSEEEPGNPVVNEASDMNLCPLKMSNYF